LKLLLDEMYQDVIGKELRARGHDVVSVYEVPERGTPDEQVFASAQFEERAVVTENVRDYRRLAIARLAAGDRHYGLVLTTVKRWPRRNPGALIGALDRLLAATPEQPMDTDLWL
jgi:hypothetical protein